MLVSEQGGTVRLPLSVFVCISLASGEADSLY